MPLADWQISFGGLTMGVGTSYDVVELRGIDDLVSVRSSDLDPVRDGLVAGNDYLGARIVVAEIEMVATTDAAFAALVAALRSATAKLVNTETALSFKYPGVEERTIFARPRRRSLPTDVLYSLRFGRATVEWAASDPRVYSAAVTTTVLV